MLTKNELEAEALTKNEMEDLAMSTLASSVPDEQKIISIFHVYREEIKRNYPALYYALLGWQDSNKSRIWEQARPSVTYIDTRNE